MDSTIRIRDGKVYAVSEFPHSSTPTMRRLWFLLDISPEMVKDGGRAVYQSGRGTWGVERSTMYGSGLECRAIGERNEYGSVIAAIIEDEPIPCPKVRKGVETRWNGSHGRWEKLLKAGWVTL